MILGYVGKRLGGHEAENIFTTEITLLNTEEKKVKRALIELNNATNATISSLGYKASGNRDLEGFFCIDINSESFVIYTWNKEREGAENVGYTKKVK